MLKAHTFVDKLFSGIAFKMLYLSLALLSFNAFTYYQPWMKYLVLLVTLFGAINCFYRLINYKKFIKTPYLALGLLFLTSYLLTIVINIRFGLSESFQGLIWMSFQILMLYCFDMEKPLEDQENEFRRIGTIFVIYTSLACLAGLTMLYLNYGELYVVSKEIIVPRGFVWGRLWGVFTDPNYGSVSVCLSMILCIYYFRNTNIKIIKILVAISMTVSFFYLVFSDSRTGYVALTCSLFVIIYFMFSADKKPKTEKKSKKILLHRVLPAIVSLFITIGTIGAVIATKETYNYAISVHQVANPQNDKQIKRSSEVEETDLSNRRLSIWKSGLEIFEKSPVAGVGFRNIVAAAEEKAPDTYIINNSFVKFNAFHNMWLDVLVSQGIIGIVIFLAFTLCCLSAVIRSLLFIRKHKPENLRLFAVLLSSASVCLVSSLFLSDTVYVNTPNAVIFWIFLGYLMSIFNQSKKHNFQQSL